MAQFSEDIKSLRNYFNTGVTKKLSWRKEQLSKLISLVKENSESIIDSVHADLHQSKFQAELSEVQLPATEAEYHLNNVTSWVQPQYVEVDKMFKPGKGFSIYEPLGVVLIIAPWNYPLSLILKPLVGAISAGNCVVIKPSEVSRHSAKWASTYIPKYLDNKAVRVIEGGPEETTQLLKEKFDHIFYTGSTQVGKIVMKAASEHLTPVTLELGGKSPCIVASDADLDVSARRIISGKYGNSGQTCVAPDYILADSKIEEKLIEKLKSTIKTFYSENPQTSSDYARIISERHTQRIANLIDSSKVVYGGKVDYKDNYIEPTLIKTSRNDTSKLMDEEIFGPLLPVVTYDNIDEAVQYINDKPKPLALYVFSSNTQTQDHVLSTTSSGGVCINDTLFHILDKNLPFGGVGPSGMGSYNGKTTFETFSHKKSVLRRPTWLDPAIRYPPFDEKKIWWFKTLTRAKLPVAAKQIFMALLFITIAIAGYRYFS